MFFVMASGSVQQLPVLAPHPTGGSVGTPRKTSTGQRTEEEWAVVYPHIERMYVRERRKLRYVMNKMEEHYNFHAT